MVPKKVGDHDPDPVPAALLAYGPARRVVPFDNAVLVDLNRDEGQLPRVAKELTVASRTVWGPTRLRVIARIGSCPFPMSLSPRPEAV